MKVKKKRRHDKNMAVDRTPTEGLNGCYGLVLDAHSSQQKG